MLIFAQQGVGLQATGRGFSGCGQVTGYNVTECVYVKM